MSGVYIVGSEEIEVKNNGSTAESFLFVPTDGVILKNKVSKYNCLIIDVKGLNRYFYVQGLNHLGTWVNLRLITEGRVLIGDYIPVEGRYFVDIRGYDEIRLSVNSSGGDFSVKVTLTVDSPPDILSTYVRYKKITAADLAVEGYFWAIEPLTDIIIHSNTKHAIDISDAVFAGETRLAGQVLFGPFRRVQISSGTALLVYMI